MKFHTFRKRSAVAFGLVILLFVNSSAAVFAAEVSTEAAVSDTQGAADPQTAESEAVSGPAVETEYTAEASTEIDTAPVSEPESETEAVPEPTEPQVQLNGPDIKAETYCVINADTGEILMSKDPHKRMYPASTTKVMTALLVLENIEDLDQKLTFSQSAVHIDPSSSTLNPKAMAGEVMSVKDALYGMLLSSANEYGAMLGEFIAGSEEAFAQMMNARAERLGAFDTHFVNAYGIHDPEHYTTAYDLCLILQEAMKNERYRKLNQTIEYHIPKTNMSNERTCIMGHQMLNHTIPEAGVIGGKTGSTPQAGRVLVTAVNRDGLYTISSLMHSDLANYYKDEQVLLEFTYGFHNRKLPPVEWVETNDYVKAAETVRLRYSPSLLGAEYGAFEKGDTLLREGIYGDWSKIRVEGAGEFYAYSEYLTSMEPEKVPLTTAYEWPTEEPTEEPTTEPAVSEKTPEEDGSKKETKREIPTTSVVASEKEETDMGETGIIEILMIVLPIVIILLLGAIWLIVFLQHRDRRKKRRKK